MENPGNSSNQSRFLIAAALSMVVLFGWSYFFTPKKPADNANANVAANTNTAVNTAPAATPAPAPAQTTQAPQQTGATAPVTPDTTPNRTITIKSPLYEVTIDSKGALATSWIIVKNLGPRSEFPVYADGSTDADKKPLQLISPYALSQTPREIPFRLSTDDQNLNTLVNDRNYQISVPEDTITLAAGEERPVEFTLTDASGVEVKKSFVFRANSYVADLGISLKKGGQPVPNTKLLIGASVGDQGIPHHNF